MKKNDTNLIKSLVLQLRNIVGVVMELIGIRNKSMQIRGLENCISVFLSNDAIPY